MATITAALSLALAVAAARWGWLGPDVGRGDGFCEAARAGWIRQPANTWSNLGFVVAGLSIAWYAGERARLGVTLGAHPGLATAYAVLVVLLGPGSMAMHATQTDLGGHLDLLSMYLVSGFALAYALMRFVHRGPAFLAVVFAVAVLAGMAVHLRGGSVPVLGHVGNAAFGVEILVALGAGGGAVPPAGARPAPGPVVRGRLGRHAGAGVRDLDHRQARPPRGATPTPCCSSTASGTCSARCRPT